MPTDENIIPETQSQEATPPASGYTFQTSFDDPEDNDEEIPSYSFGEQKTEEQSAESSEQKTEENTETQNTETKEESTEENQETTETSTESKAEEWDEEKAFAFLKEKKGFEAASLEDLLKPKEVAKPLNPLVEKFQEFIEKTGNEKFEDFLQTQKDWTQEEPTTVLMEALKADNPELTEKQLNFLFNKKYSTDGLDEEIDEDLIMEKEINAKTDLKKALDFLEKRKEEYAVNRGSDEHIPSEYKEAKEFRENLLKEQKKFEDSHAENRQDYVAKIENLFKDFDGIKVKLGNDEAGYEEVSFKPDDVNSAKQRYLDVANFNNKFFDETGKLTDPKAWVEALYIAENFQSELNKAYNRGMAKKAEMDDKLSKNIQPDNIRDVNSPVGNKVIYTRVE